MSAERIAVVCSERAERVAGLERLFRGQQIALRTVADGQALHALLREVTPELVLLDTAGKSETLSEFLGVLEARQGWGLAPVLILGRGELAERAAARLRGRALVRVVDLGHDAELAAPRRSEHVFPIRRHPRVPLAIPVLVDMGDGGLTSVRSHDLSEEGMGFIFGTSLATGQRIHLTFTLPGDRHPEMLDAEVRRTIPLAGGGAFVGAWFRDLGEADRGRLRAYVDRHLDAVG